MRGDIQFSPRNFAWKKYSNQFNKYRNCKEPESKKYHRKHLEHLRKAVDLCTTVFISNLVSFPINKKGPAQSPVWQPSPTNLERNNYGTK